MEEDGVDVVDLTGDSGDEDPITPGTDLAPMEVDVKVSASRCVSVT